MYQFFVEEQQISGTQIRVSGPDAHHMLHVLRLKPGEEVSVRVLMPVSEAYRDAELRCAFQGEGPQEADGSPSAMLSLLFIKQDNVELPATVILYQAIPKADKMEFIVQKAVELGAVRIVPVITKRCVSDWTGKEAKKRQRLQGIAEAAAKQAKRGIVPAVLMPKGFADAMREAAAAGRVLVPYELVQPMHQTASAQQIAAAQGQAAAQSIEALKLTPAAQQSTDPQPPAESQETAEAQPIAAQPSSSPMDRTREIFSSIRPGDTVSFFIGPEGGFTEEEIAIAGENGAECITLGRRILRTETAGLYVLSVLGYLLEQ